MLDYLPNMGLMDISYNFSYLELLKHEELNANKQ